MIITAIVSDRADVFQRDTPGEISDQPLQEPADHVAGDPEPAEVRLPLHHPELHLGQARGAVLRALRDAATHVVPLAEIAADWPDPLQRDRAIDSLIADGLAEASEGFLRLPE